MAMATGSGCPGRDPPPWLLQAKAVLIVTLQLHVANSAGCCGLADLLTAQRLARRSGGDVLLAAPVASVRRLLSLTSTAELLGVHATVDAAVASIGRDRPAAVPAYADG